MSDSGVCVTVLPARPAFIQLELPLLHRPSGCFPPKTKKQKQRLYFPFFSPGSHLPLSPLGTCRSTHLDRVSLYVCVCERESELSVTVFGSFSGCARSPGGLHNVTASVCDLPPRCLHPLSPSVCLSQGDFTSGHEGEDRTSECVGGRRGRRGVTEEERCGSPLTRSQPACVVLCCVWCVFVCMCARTRCV